MPWVLTFKLDPSHCGLQLQIILFPHQDAWNRNAKIPAALLGSCTYRVGVHGREDSHMHADCSSTSISTSVWNDIRLEEPGTLITHGQYNNNQPLTQ